MEEMTESERHYDLAQDLMDAISLNGDGVSPEEVRNITRRIFGLSPAEQHAIHCIDKFEQLFPQRGCTRGIPKWEEAMLVSAYNALNIPPEHRIFKENPESRYDLIKENFVSRKKRELMDKSP